MDKVVSDSNQCKVYYNGQREYGIFQRLKQDESATFLAEISEQIRPWTRNLRNDQSAGKVFEVIQGVIDNIRTML